MTVCAGATLREAGGLNGGKNGGRACWAVSGTLCGGQVQGAFASKVSNCVNSGFYKAVALEQGDSLASKEQVLDKIGQQAGLSSS